MFYARINKIKVFNNREGFLGLFNRAELRIYGYVTGWFGEVEAGVARSLQPRKLAVVMDIDTTSAPLIEENKNKTHNKKYASDNLFVINSLVSLSCVYLRVVCKRCAKIFGGL